MRTGTGGEAGRTADLSAAFNMKERVRRRDTSGIPTLKMKKNWWAGLAGRADPEGDDEELARQGLHVTQNLRQLLDL